MSVDSVQMARVFRRLLDAAADFDKWPLFLQELAGLFDARGANLMHFDHADNRLGFSMQYGYDNVSLSKLERMAELFPEDPRIAYAMRHAGMPVTCRQCVDEETLHASRVYKEFLGPAEVEYTMGVHFMEETSGYALSVMRGPEGSPFTEADTALFGEFIPSVKRAIELHKRLAMLDFEKRLAFEAFDGMPLGLVLVSKDGEVMFANRTALEISEAGDGFTIAGRRFYFHDRTETGRVLDYIRQAVESAHSGQILPAEGSAVMRPSGERAYEAVVTTVWGNHLKFGMGQLGEPVAVLFIADPDRPQEAPAELLQRLYGLTPAEAGVVERLVAGDSVAEIARTRSLSEYTVREHLGVAFEKTGTGRQADLIKRVLSSPTWIAAQEQREKFAEARAMVS